MCVRVCVCVRACVRVCVPVCVRACMHARMYVYMYACVQTPDDIKIYLIAIHFHSSHGKHYVRVNLVEQFSDSYYKWSAVAQW